MPKRKVEADGGDAQNTVVFRGTADGHAESCVRRFYNFAGMLYMLDEARRTGLAPDWDRILLGWNAPSEHFRGQRTADAAVVMDQLVGKIPGLSVRHTSGRTGGRFEVLARNASLEKASWLVSELRERVEAVLEEQRFERDRYLRDAELSRLPGILAQPAPYTLDEAVAEGRLDEMVRTLLLRLAEQPRSREPLPPTGDWVVLRLHGMAVYRLSQRGLGIHDLFYLRAIAPKADSRTAAAGAR